MPVRRKILVVDDNPCFGETTKEVLEDKGYEVTVVAGPKGYYGVINDVLKGKKRFDAVIMDMYFPDSMVKGIDLVQYAKGRGLDSLPFIVVSGIDQKYDKGTFSELGISTFLRKPLNYQTLEAYLKDTIFGSNLKNTDLASRKMDFLANLDHLDMYKIFFNYFDPLKLSRPLSDDEMIYVSHKIKERTAGGMVLLRKTIDDVIIHVNGNIKKNIVHDQICNDRQYLEFILRYLNSGFIQRQEVLDRADPNETTVSGFISEIKKKDKSKKYAALLSEFEGSLRGREAYHIARNHSLMYAFSRVKRSIRAMNKILTRTADTMTDLKLYGHPIGAREIEIISENVQSNDYFGVKIIAPTPDKVLELFNKCSNFFGNSKNYRVEDSEYHHTNYRRESSIPRLFVRRGDDLAILDPDEHPDMIEVLVCCPGMLIRDEYIGKNAHALHEKRDREYKDSWTRKQRNYRDDLLDNFEKENAVKHLIMQSV
jgi:CheY-like chemotaxis protein